MFLAVLLGAAAALPAELNPAPIIGVVSQPKSGTTNSYIAASYVKWVESSGGRVVPVILGTATSELDALLEGLNGLLWPGGGADFHNGTYADFARHLWDKGLALNDAGNYFPMWGTCLGFEFANVMAGGEDVLTCDWDAEDLPLPLVFAPGARSSPLLAGTSDALFNAMSTQNLTQNEHKCSVAPSAYVGKLGDFFSVAATGIDRKGGTFSALVAGKTYPVWGSQFHPEKNNFEWYSGEAVPIPHSANAVLTSQHFANFFVNEARKSGSRLKDPISQLIYNYQPVYTGKEPSGYFVQEYHFPVPS
jgi:gamma-glutamyl hydrolase